MLEHNLFSSASDVWSFGILCIEVFTLGARPFGGWADSMVVAQVASGFTPTIPPTCPAVFFTDVIEPCFAAEPGDRPLFAKLSQATQQSTSRAATVGIARRFRHDEPEQVETRIRVSEVERGLLQSGEPAERDSPLQKPSSPWAKIPRSHVFREPGAVTRELSLIDEEEERQQIKPRSRSHPSRASDPAASWLSATPSTTLGWSLGGFMAGDGAESATDDPIQTYEDDSDDEEAAAFLL